MVDIRSALSALVNDKNLAKIHCHTCATESDGSLLTIILAHAHVLDKPLQQLSRVFHHHDSACDYQHNIEGMEFLFFLKRNCGEGVNTTRPSEDRVASGHRLTATT